MGRCVARQFRRRVRTGAAHGYDRNNTLIKQVVEKPDFDGDDLCGRIDAVSWQHVDDTLHEFHRCRWRRLLVDPPE